MCVCVRACYVRVLTCVCPCVCPAGVTTDEQSRWGAWIMIATMFPFLILQLPVLFGLSSYAAWVADVIALILTLMALVAYCAYQVRNLMRGTTHAVDLACSLRHSPPIHSCTAQPAA